MLKILKPRKQLLSGLFLTKLRKIVKLVAHEDEFCCGKEEQDVVCTGYGSLYQTGKRSTVNLHLTPSSIVDDNRSLERQYFLPFFRGDIYTG